MYVHIYPWSWRSPIAQRLQFGHKRRRNHHAFARCPGPRDEAFARSKGLDGKFVVLYLGAHGISHALSRLLDAAEHLERADVQLTAQPTAGVFVRHDPRTHRNTADRVTGVLVAGGPGGLVVLMGDGSHVIRVGPPA